MKGLLIGWSDCLCQTSRMILFINKNKNIGSKEMVDKLNIFEDDFAIIEDDIDVLEEFIKENGEVDEEVE